MSTQPVQSAHVSRWASGAFGRRIVPVPQCETQFDELVLKLGLANYPELWHDSQQLHHFAKKNRNTRYVPEFLLAEWGIDVLVGEL